jgi:large subunit ribosomal protein L25
VSKQEISLTLDKRQVVGKGLSKLKKSGLVPAVIHQPGSESLNVSGNFVELSKVYSLAGKHHPIVVTYDNKQLLTIIRDADFDPKKRQLRHVVFGVIDKNEKVETEVSIVLVGDSAAAKTGLLVHQNIDSVAIEALPKNLVDVIEVSIEALTEVGDKITVGDIKAPAGVTILTDPEFPVATVESPRQEDENEESDTNSETSVAPEPAKE